MRGMMFAFMLFIAACLAKSREADAPFGEDAPTSPSDGSNDAGEVIEEDTDGGDASPPVEEPTPSEEEDPVVPSGEAEPVAPSEDEEDLPAPAGEETAEEPPVEDVLPIVEDCANAVDDNGDDAVDCDDYTCADDPACAVRIDSVDCTSLIGGTPTRCEVRGRFVEGVGEDIHGLTIQCLVAFGMPQVDANDSTLAIIEGCWTCGCGDSSPDASYRIEGASCGLRCHQGVDHPNIGMLLPICTDYECGTADRFADVCGFSCAISSPGCGFCDAGVACTNGSCDYSAIPETCNGFDDNHDGSVDEGLTRPCETACGDGMETCSDGVWVDCDALPELPEACDGTDNDCDGTVDDGCVCAVGTFESCGTTVGECDTGIRWCMPTGWDAACEGAIGRAEEICNGLDDNCDGTTDEGCLCHFGATEPCGIDTGACVTGTRQCTASGWGACTGDSGPTDEVCDGADNDCDGAIDEGFYIGIFCSAPGVCASNWKGKLECDAGDPHRVVCSMGLGGSAYLGGSESCDRQDNDCDGATDEDFSDLRDPCIVGVGICERSGERVCRSDGTGTKCGAIPGSSRSESCNNTDDDCDGSTDEELTRACSTRCGSGTETCSAGVWVGCTAPSVPIEVCDGVDNDCDGTVDDGCPCVVYTTRSCGMDTGECQKGEQECVATDAGSSWWEDCIGAIGRVDETCNRLDDDCDGSTDEGFGVGTYCDPPGDCGWGYVECDQSDSSRAICAEGPGGSSYNGGPERCDNRDNDCDGATDEDFALGSSCVIGVGACVRSGTTTCSADTWGTRCSVNSGTPQPETCDGLDNDCDGIADNGLGDTCCLSTSTRPCGSDTGECVAGTQTCGSDRRWGGCSGVVATTERCDTRDNDCDGGTDEDFSGLGDPCTGTCGTEGVIVCDATGAVAACDAVCGPVVIDDITDDDLADTALRRSCTTCGTLTVEYTVDAGSFDPLRCVGVSGIADALTAVEEGVAMWKDASGLAMGGRIALIPDAPDNIPPEIIVLCGDARVMCGSSSAVGCSDGTRAMVHSGYRFSRSLLVNTVAHEVGHALSLPHSNGSCSPFVPPCPDRGVMCCALQDTTTLACSDEELFLTQCGECSECCGCGGVPYVTCASGATIETCTDDGCGCHRCDTEACADSAICTDGTCERDACAGISCDLPRAVTTCIEGSCVITGCTEAYKDCDRVAANGCESDLRATTDCGACGTRCGPFDHAMASCGTGMCTFSCTTGYRDCDGDPWNGCETSGPCGGCPECQTWNGTACVPAANGSTCTSDGNACTMDACASGACAHAQVSCATPPAPTCVGSWTLRTFTASGTCGGGSCSYPSYDTTCANGCSGGACVSDPCAGVSCSDGSSCTTDVCVSGSCQYTTISNDCGGRTCGSSPSGCFSCGSCPAGQECSGGSCVTACTCSPGATESRGCEDPSPYISYCVFEEKRTCAGACTWGAWGSCTADRRYNQYGVDIGKWCDDTCITLTSCSGGTCTGYFSAENSGTFKSTDAYWRVVGDDGTSLAEPFACVSLKDLTRVWFSFPSSRLHLTASSTYRGVSGTVWGGDNCVTNPPYTTDTTWVERCY